MKYKKQNLLSSGNATSLKELKPVEKRYEKKNYFIDLQQLLMYSLKKKSFQNKFILVKNSFTQHIYNKDNKSTNYKSLMFNLNLKYNFNK